MATNGIAENVLAFMHEASSTYGAMKSQLFFRELLECDLLEHGTQSPIEDLFYIALKVVCAAEYIDVNPGPVSIRAVDDRVGFGVFIHPQFQVGKYRVDFLVVDHTVDDGQKAIVELDGHDFHDKNKQQRAYEKQRDRFLTRAGYKVLHFTGSEVASDPYKVASEVLETIGAAEIIWTREDMEAF